MYLKRIELLGFKSFTSKTKIDFEPGISCIVGPNGSGKSNVADALRWVLGEQNARSIRGGKLEDVIFAGTQKRRPLSIAEVSIILDNSDGHLDIPTSEVSVTRRAIRGGGSEYLINDKFCRLKDIHDLFVDTGVSVDGLSIINQGRVNELINARPDERRALVEEAAGIIKYRDRKREAVRRLAETQRHLETIGAVISELSDRIEPLSAQAQKAEKYLELKKESDDLEIGICVKVLTESGEKIAALEDKLEETRKKLMEEESQRLALSAEAEQLRLSINEMDETVAASSKEYYEKQTSREKAEGELAVARSLKQNADMNIQRLDKELAALENTINGKKLEIDELAAHVERTKNEINKAEEDILSGQGGQEDIRSHAGLLSDKLMQLRRELNEATAEETSFARDVEFKEELFGKNQSEIQEIQSKLQQLHSEQEAESSAVAELRSQHQQLNKEIKQKIDAANTFEMQLRELNHELEEAAVEEADRRYKVSSARTRVAMLEEMAAAYEGFFPGVKGLMTARRQGKAPAGIIGVISELMDVPEEYRVAVEAYLGANIQNVVTKDAASAKAAVAYLKKNDLGRATFLPLDILKVREGIKAAPAGAGVYGIASGLIGCEKEIRPAVDFLLNNVVIAQDMDAAMAAARELKYHSSVVTLDGDMVNPGASISGGSRNKKSADLLGQKSKLKKAKEELVQAEAALAKLEEENLVLRQKLHEMNDQSAGCREAVQQLSGQATEAEQELSRLDFAAAERGRQVEEINARLEILSQEEQHIRATMAEAKDSYSRATAGRENIEQEISTVSEELAVLQEKISGSENEQTQLKMDLASSKQKLYGQTLTLNRLNEEMVNLGWEAEEKDADRRLAVKEALASAEDISRLEELLQDMARLLHDAGVELEEKKHGLAAETGRLMELEKQEKEKGRAKEILQNDVHQLELRREHWLADYDNEAAKLEQSFQLDLEGAKARIGDLGSRTAMNSRLAQLRREINALGQVNVGAIEEHAEVSARYDFLTGQREDMLNARAKLDKVIAEMDKIMAGRFRDAYGRLSDAFNSSFNRLFGGGSASLYLSEPDDILETGVEIRVDPPGKKVANYNLLSGGEKSLVGIALMFAMLAVRPTPFCVMDEVDAALDEANIGRFTDYLQEKAAGGQFIMITHRQSTMEAAQALWGVTMEEEGVSTVLSVKLDQVS